MSLRIGCYLIPRQTVVPSNPVDCVTPLLNDLDVDTGWHRTLVKPGVTCSPMLVEMQLSSSPQTILIDQRGLCDEHLRRGSRERRQDGLEHAGIALRVRIRQLLNQAERPQ